MKLKKLLKLVKEAGKIEDSTIKVLNCKYHEETIGVMYNIILDLAMTIAIGDDYDNWCSKVGNDRDEHGKFIVDGVFESVYSKCSVRDLKHYIKAGNEAIEKDKSRSES